MLQLLIAVATSLSSYAVQNSECITPRGKPRQAASIIYMHGWFPGSGSGSYVSLERRNRAKLQKLADLTGQTIAVPVSKKFNGKSYRSWSPYGGGAGRLAAAESMARQACGSLAVPRSLLGFSDGGYAARAIGLECAAKRQQYAAVIMTGASPMVGGVGGRECAPLIFTGGRSDGTTQMGAAATMVRNLRARGREAETWPAYAGGHDIPSGEEMARLFGSKMNINVAQTTEPAQVASGPAAPARPTRPTDAAQPPPRLRPPAATNDGPSGGSFMMQ